jgi:glycosyltransferase involved in cell wall biosynthesis
VSVVLPFLGTRDEAAEAAARLAAIEGRGGDELILVDNSPDGVALPLDGHGGVRVLAATVKRSAYAARNEGAELARNDWLLFTDADCRPQPAILDDYFAEPIEADCGALAGEILGAPEQASLAARWGRSRRILNNEANSRFAHLPMAPTANLLVRKRAFEELGGFPEGMTAAGGDILFCWRLQEAGWKLGFRSGPIVWHLHRETVGGLLRQTARDAAGIAWLNRLYPGAIPRPPLLAPLFRAGAGAVLFALMGQIERARMKAVDGLVVGAQTCGYLRSHGGHGPAAPARRILIVEEFPRRDRPPPSTTAAPDAGLRVEAARRAPEPDWPRARGVTVRFWEDDGKLRRAVDAAWLALRHPKRVIADRRGSSAPGARIPLPGLAPAVRRVAASPEAEVEAEADPSARRLADRVAALAGRDQMIGVR